MVFFLKPRSSMSNIRTDKVEPNYKKVRSPREDFEKRLDEKKVYDRRKRNLLGQDFYLADCHLAKHKGFEYVVTFIHGSYIAKGRRRYGFAEVVTDQEYQQYVDGLVDGKSVEEILKDISTEVLTGLPKSEYE